MTFSLSEVRQKDADPGKGNEEFDLCLCWQQTHTNTSYAKFLQCVLQGLNRKHWKISVAIWHLNGNSQTNSVPTRSYKNKALEVINEFFILFLL